MPFRSAAKLLPSDLDEYNEQGHGAPSPIVDETPSKRSIKDLKRGVKTKLMLIESNK